MELNFNSLDEVKIKFARLLSYLFFDAKIELDNISKAMIESPFLDIFEENRLNDFMSMPFEQMAKVLFPKLNVPYQISGNDIGEVYWSGLQYMNILMNYRVPLRTVFILLPLKEMVKKYLIYHEMNEIELCRDFMANEYKNNSILKYFRNNSSLSVRELSFLSNIPEATIKYLDNNDNFYNATNKSLESLVKVLEIDFTFLKRHSSFIPVTYNLLNNYEFVVEISRTIGDFYLGGKLPNLNIKFYKDRNLDIGKAFLIVDNGSFLIINGKETLIDDNVFKSILDKTVNRYLKNNLINNLVF